MSRLREINEKMQNYIANLGSNIDQAVISVDWQLLDLIRDQIKGRQKNGADRDITPIYSPYWRSKKGLIYPNLYNTGQWQAKFVLNVHYPQYEAHSTDWKNEKLIDKYGKSDPLVAVAPSSKQKAYSITNHAIGKSIKSKVGLI